MFLVIANGQVVNFSISDVLWSYLVWYGMWWFPAFRGAGLHSLFSPKMSCMSCLLKIPSCHLSLLTDGMFYVGFSGHLALSFWCVPLADKGRNYIPWTPSGSLGWLSWLPWQVTGAF